MKTRLIVVLGLLALCGCAADVPRSSGSLADGTFQQEIGKPRQTLFSPDCLVH